MLFPGNATWDSIWQTATQRQQSLKNLLLANQIVKGKHSAIQGTHYISVFPEVKPTALASWKELLDARLFKSCKSFKNDPT